MTAKISLTVLVVTKNEERNLPRCLAALERFDDVVVVDSNSNDATADIARSFGATFIPFTWNGGYPKRQWCLDTLPLKHDRVFFVDADEEVTPALCDEIAALDWNSAGYFVKGTYVISGKPLRFGLKNNKLCLFDRRLIEFPVVDDLDILGMGEIEGHYQPVLKHEGYSVGSLKDTLHHYALEDTKRWLIRHENYAKWQKSIEERAALPKEPLMIRYCLKWIFSKIPIRGSVAFFHSYIIKGGILDGQAGIKLALSRKLYYDNIN